MSDSGRESSVEIRRYDARASAHRRGNLRLIARFLSLALLCTVFAVAGNAAAIDCVVRGIGRIAPFREVEPIYSENGLFILKIFVEEGQEVRQGDRLAQLSDTDVSESRSLLHNEAGCRLVLKRLEAEARGIPLVYTEEERAEYAGMVEEQERLHAARPSTPDSERRAAIVAERDDCRRQIDGITEKLRACFQVDIMELRAPLPGVVKRIILKEESAVQPGQTIMELQLADDFLEVNARFRTADRALLGIGQDVVVKAHGSDASIYGSLPAKVVRISSDTVEDGEGRFWYEVWLTAEGRKLVHDNRELEIRPGMTVTVEVVSGRRTFFD